MVQNSLENLRENSPKSPLYIGLEKTSCWAIFQPRRLAVDRAGRPPTVRNLTVGATVDRPGRPLPGTENKVLCRSTGPVDRGFPESRSSLRSTGVGRPAIQPELACTSVHVGRPTPSSVDRSGRPAEARSEQLRD